MAALSSSNLATHAFNNPSLPRTIRQHSPGTDDAFVKLSSDILRVVSRYQLRSPKGSTSERPQNTLKFLSAVYEYVKLNQPIQMCLPAFPFKSPNSQNKVLGRLPDMAEEFALSHLDGLCSAIEDLYPPGAELTIISDGLVYNDLLGVPDRDVWAYGSKLRNLVKEKRLNHIKFSRLQDLLHTNMTEELNEITYVANATEFRRSLLNTFSRPTYDASFEISNSEDTCLTYRGYIQFLATDLKHVYPVGPERSKTKFKQGTEYIAKQMLRRGDAFARAVRERFPNHLRLSIHPSNGRSKISISLLPTTSRWTTPWHCTMALKLDGTIHTGPREAFDSDPTFELAFDKLGRPSYYREKSDLFSWGQNVKIRCDPMYPCGLLIRPAGKELSLSITDVDGERVRKLVELNSPVVLRGFARTGRREMFVKKAEEMGTPLPWKSDLILEVKDLGEGSRGSGNSLSAEPMPFHYDGVFKTETRVNEDGTTRVVPLPPKLQFFTAVTPSPKNTGYTLFASSKLLFEYLPENLSLTEMEQTTWTVSTPSFGAVTLHGVPLVVQHPETGRPCLRYHEHWPQSKTNFDPMEIAIEGCDRQRGDEICQIIDSLLYDRRVTYWHSWDKGDLLLNDNFSMMHTRTEFLGGSDRELWRIHID